jgi:hypothetical protein
MVIVSFIVKLVSAIDEGMRLRREVMTRYPYMMFES